MNIVFSQEDLDRINDEKNFEVPINFPQYKGQGNTWYMKGKPDPMQYGVRIYYQGKTKKDLLNYYNLCQQKNK